MGSEKHFNLLTFYKTVFFTWKIHIIGWNCLLKPNKNDFAFANSFLIRVKEAAVVN